MEQEPCYDQNGNLQWYPDKHFQNGDISGTFRHADCIFASYEGNLIDGMCSFCATLETLRSFKGRLERKFKAENAASSDTIDRTPFDYKNKTELVARLRSARQQEETLKKENFFLKCDLERLQKRSKAWKDELKQISSKGSFSGIANKVTRAVDNGLVKGKEGVVNILKTICQNIPKQKKGHRYKNVENNTFAEMMEVTLILGGPRVCSFVADNLEGPHIDQIKRWHSMQSFRYDFRDKERNVKFVAELYKSFKTRLGIIEKIPYLKIEDETAIEPRPEFDQSLNVVWGYCGKKDQHECEDIYFIEVGDDLGAYDRLIQDMNSSQLASHARAIMINPLHPNLPRTVIHLQANRNTFTHNAVLNQWLLYDELCKRNLDPVLDPDIGKGSDGDSRRRKLFLNQSSDANGGRRFKPIPVSDGFLFSGRLKTNENGEAELKDLSDSDYIHNHKKLDNHLDYVTRDLRPGLYPAHRNYLRAVAQAFARHIHGLRDEDINKRDRQNWASAQRTSFPCVRQCLEDIVHGRNVLRDPTARSTSIYLELVYYYMEIFVSLEATLYERIKYAGAVVTFLGIWRNYVVLTPGLTLKDNFLTRETFQDVLLSAHTAVMVISWFAINHNNIPCYLNLRGTDAVEVYFSQNGSWVLNKHTYTIFDMMQNLTAMNRLNHIRATNNLLRFRKAHSKQDNIWEKQYTEERRRELIQSLPDKLKNYPTEEEVISAWKEGIELAKDMARRAGMRGTERNGINDDGNDDDNNGDDDDNNGDDDEKRGDNDNSDSNDNQTDNDNSNGDGDNSDSNDNQTDNDNSNRDDDKWFSKPFEYMNFEKVLADMRSDEIDATINPSVDTDEIDEDGCLLFEGDVEQRCH